MSQQFVDRFVAFIELVAYRDGPAQVRFGRSWPRQSARFERPASLVSLVTNQAVTGQAVGASANSSGARIREE